MTAHTLEHDPLFDHAECEVCNAALRKTFNRLAGIDLDAETVDELADRVVASALAILAEEYADEAKP